jgi:hypothetical protein
MVGKVILYHPEVGSITHLPLKNGDKTVYLILLFPLHLLSLISGREIN